MPAYTVSRVDLERERQPILDLWRRNQSGRHAPDERFDWHFLRNPYGPGRCWLLRDDSGRAVGTTALGMRPLKAGASVVTAGAACDLAVDAEHRFLQAALVLQRAVVGAVTPELPVVYGLPNPQAAAPMRRVGYKEVGVVDRYAKPLRPSAYLRRRRLTAPLAPVLGGVLDFAYGAVSRLRERPPRGYVAEVMTGFDRRFDDLWERLKPAHAVIGVRDSRYLSWRYGECPLQSYTTVGLLTPDRSRLLGYLIHYVLGGIALCADLFTGEDAGEARALVAAWLAEARRRGATSASVHCRVHPAVLEALRRLGFRQRTVSAGPRPAHPGDAQPNRAVLAFAWPGLGAESRGPWYFTPGDEPYN